MKKYLHWKNHNRSSPLSTEKIRKDDEQKIPFASQKRGRLASKRKIRIRPAPSFSGDNLFIRILQKAKILAYCIFVSLSSPFYAVLIFIASPFSYFISESPPFLHSIHRTIHIASPLFTAFREVIHLIHSLMHVFPTFAQSCGRISKFRLFHRICRRLSFLCTIPLPFSLILIHDFT